MMRRIVDFIQSWIFYPKMVKYFCDRGMENCNPWYREKFARIRYSWWHCHVGKLKNI